MWMETAFQFPNPYSSIPSSRASSSATSQPPLKSGELKLSTTIYGLLDLWLANSSPLAKHWVQMSDSESWQTMRTSCVIFLPQEGAWQWNSWSRVSAYCLSRLVVFDMIVLRLCLGECNLQFTVYFWWTSENRDWRIFTLDSKGKFMGLYFGAFLVFLIDQL